MSSRTAKRHKIAGPELQRMTLSPLHSSAPFYDQRRSESGDGSSSTNNNNNSENENKTFLKDVEAKRKERKAEKREARKQAKKQAKAKQQKEREKLQPSSINPADHDGDSDTAIEAEKKKAAGPWGIFGLGNVPSSMFKGTRHNIGRSIVKRLAKYHQCTLDLSKAQTTYGLGSISDQAVYFCKPNTLMNRSGRSVRGIVDLHGVPDKQIIVIYDDLALPLGTIRLRNRGTSGGQNGVRDVIKQMGEKSRFIRLRVGIGAPHSTSITSKFVLSRFSGEEQDVVERTKHRVIACVQLLMKTGLADAMNRYNHDAAAFDEREQKEKTKRKDLSKEKKKSTKRREKSVGKEKKGRADDRESENVNMQA